MGRANKWYLYSPKIFSVSTTTATSGVSRSRRQRDRRRRGRTLVRSRTILMRAFRLEIIRASPFHLPSPAVRFLPTGVFFRFLSLGSAANRVHAGREKSIGQGVGVTEQVVKPHKYNGFTGERERAGRLRRGYSSPRTRPRNEPAPLLPLSFLPTVRRSNATPTRFA